MITSVQVQNFKNLRKQEINLEPLTVFVGANGSGKTSVLDAIHLAVRAATGDPDKVFGYQRHCDWLYTRDGQGDMSIMCRTAGGEFAVNASPPAGFPPAPDFLGKGQWEFKFTPTEFTAREDALRPARLLVFLHLNSTQLAAPSYADRHPPRVEYDGEGLASVLAYMALNDPDAFEELLSHMRGLIPNLKRIRFRKAAVKRLEKEFLRVGDESVERRTNRVYQGEAILFDFTNANNVSAHTVSEGTLMLLGLLTVLLGPTHPKILLMDDIEHGLHPLAQKALLDVLAKVMQTFPDVQVLASAHSPYLLDHLRPEQIRLMTIDKDGYAACGRLDDHPLFERWKDEMAPGELWSLFGEKWLAEGGMPK
ncbi:MAG: AAA family ATPase [Planctomycetia bacterium]|nr:AAA family ATPase [Planctomycetia bacterium]